MFDPNSPDLVHPAPPVTRDGPDMPAFFNRHRSLFALLVVVTA